MMRHGTSAGTAETLQAAQVRSTAGPVTHEVRQAPALPLITTPVSVSDLHYRLGKLIEDRPGLAIRQDGSGGTINTDRHHFEEIEPVRSVDMGVIERLEAIAAAARAEMGEERWAELDAEWRLSPEQRDEREEG